MAGTDPRGQTLLREAGYVQVRSFWRMSRSLRSPVARATDPASVSVRALDPERDGAAVHAPYERVGMAERFQADSFERDAR